MPDEFSFGFDEFDVGVVEFSGDFWLPIVLELAEFLVEVYFFHLPVSFSSDFYRREFGSLRGAIMRLNNIIGILGITVEGR
jgi:hypothetical protein